MCEAQENAEGVKYQIWEIQCQVPRRWCFFNIVNINFYSKYYSLVIFLIFYVAFDYVAFASRLIVINISSRILLSILTICGPDLSLKRVKTVRWNSREAAIIRRTETNLAV